ncbi:unnamed protein product [Brachionus calyciflorus]|uniref:K Homology domain-containing protein n=1 Tax=Brachionus calyciflorus TaxID=104777 RepID=A0A814EKL7_9BILA|nr:unnamed protein product [Brachionus calyciflorus]
MSVEIDNYQVVDEVNNYDTIFPSLPSSGVAINPNSVWSNQNDKLSIKRHLKTTQIFHVPFEERKHRDGSKSFGFDVNKKCEEIANRLGVKIEMCGSKDQSLHVVISGLEEKVVEAKRAIVTELQTERDFKLKVPKDQHKFLIGKNGAILTKLQEKTCTKIQIPKSESNTDIITITGPKDGIDQAIHEIQLICDEQSKTGIERLVIPKLYHPWIRGFNNDIANDISQRTGAKVNIPPPLVEKDEIVVSGDREKVDAAVNEIKRIYAEKSRLNITKLAIQITKSQHKLIIGKNGSTVQDIFKEFDVYVQVPKSDSNSETIYLYGEESKLGAALTQVIAKSNSVVTTKIDVPSWLHRHMIGEKGANISKITADYPNTHVKFEPDNRITLDGPPDEVEKVKERLQNITIGLKQVMICEEVQVEPRFYAQLIGSKKTENHVAKLNKEYGVVVRLPAENSNSNIVRIEGPPESVNKAKKEFDDLIVRLENERAKDIIIDQKYHSNLIGKSGKNLNEIRAKFNDIQINIPSQAEKSDIITIRGNKNDVEKCHKYLQQMFKDMQESNYQEEMQIVKEFHRMIIGKQGAFIRKIRDDTQTRIDIPAENTDSNFITLTGKRDNVQKARRLIEEKIKELINIKEDSVEIPHQLHTALIGKGGGIIKQIRSDCGGVIINFPPESSPNDNKITLKGPAEEVKKAKQELLKLAEQKNDISYSEEVHAKLEYHRFLVGRKGTNVNTLRDKYNVRILFPNSSQNNQESSDVITIIGKKENVQKVRAELEETVKSLEEQVTEEVTVDPKWHKNFTAKRAKLINKISEENCNVKISFPKTESSQVQVKGPRDAVASAIKKIQELVTEMENQVTIEVNIKKSKHPAVIGKNGVNTQKISDDFNVNIQFPARGGEELDENDPKLDVILISGLKDDCEQAKEALIALVPIEENFDFPSKFHKDLLVNKGEALREFIQQYNVQINVPKRGENSDFISLTGTREHLENAKVALAEKLTDLELKNYTVEINNIKGEMIPQLRGRNGVECERLQKKFQVKIYFGQKGEQEKVTIIGLKKNVEECEKFIRQKIEDEESKLSQEIEVDQRVHSRIIGSQGKALAKLTDKFKVEIKFQRNSDVVIVKGKNMDQIDDACDELKNLEEEYLQDVVDRQQYVHPSSRNDYDNQNGSPNGASTGFVVKGAPWEQAPDTNNMDDFPTISTSAENGQTNGQKSMWGPRK